MSAIRGRRDDMLIIRGVNLYPSQIEHVLLGVDGRRAALPARRRAPRGSSTSSPSAASRRRGGPDLADRVQHAIREQIGVSVDVDVLAPGEIPRSEGKAVRVID